MSLSMLTTSGWIWFALTVLNVFSFFALPAGRHKIERGFFAALHVAWLLWLVTP